MDPLPAGSRFWAFQWTDGGWLLALSLLLLATGHRHHLLLWADSPEHAWIPGTDPTPHTRRAGWRGWLPHR